MAARGRDGRDPHEFLPSLVTEGGLVLTRPSSVFDLLVWGGSGTVRWL